MRDSTLLYNPLTRKEVPIPVRGILERTGTQVDGTILVPLSYLQQEYQLAGKLTGVGVRLTSAGRLDRENFVEQYNRESALQVVTLSKVEATLEKRPPIWDMSSDSERFPWASCRSRAAEHCNSSNDGRAP